MAAFYGEAYGLHVVNRVQGVSIGDEAIDEMMLSSGPKAQWSSLVLLKYLARGPSPSGELILGFTTDDLPALLERVTKAGGTVAAPIKELPELKVRVAFAADPEGHLARARPGARMNPELAARFRPVAPPRILEGAYSDDQHRRLLGVVRDHGPWPLILAHHFRSPEEVLYYYYRLNFDLSVRMRRKFPKFTD